MPALVALIAENYRGDQQAAAIGSFGSARALSGISAFLIGGTQNLASAVGTAVVGALLVALLSVGVGRAVMEHPELPEELVAQVDFDSVNFVSNAALEEVLSQTDATPAKVEAAVQLNEEERLRALKRGLLILAGISALAILPASRLPRYKPHEIPAPDAEVADT